MNQIKHIGTVSVRFYGFLIVSFVFVWSFNCFPD